MPPHRTSGILEAVSCNTKSELLRALQQGRDVLLWKLEGLGEYDRRRPLTPTGTNLLGLVKHAAWTESEYFTDAFDRPLEPPLPWTDEGDDPNVDLWATPEETTETVTDTYRRIWAHTNAVVTELDLGTTGRIPWWDEPEPTLHRVLAHMIAETHRHAGHADILRESLDGAAGLTPGFSNLPSDDPQYWTDHRNRVEQAAARFR